MIVRWRKGQEYFSLRLQQDLLGDWVITQSWGCLHKEVSSCGHTVTSSYADARTLVLNICRERKSKGFIRLPRSETQLGFDFCHKK